MDNFSLLCFGPYSSFLVTGDVECPQFTILSIIFFFLITLSSRIRRLSKKGNAKECSNYHTIALISHASKVMHKILQARLQQYMNQMFKLDLEKAEEPEIKLSTSAGSWKKQESSRKTSISALLTMPKLLTVWITINCGKFPTRCPQHLQL